MRYLAAIIVAGLLIAAVFGYAYSLKRSVIAELRKAASALPDDESGISEFKRQLEQGQFPNDFGTELSEGTIFKISLRDTLFTFWPVWSSFILAISLSVAWMTAAPSSAPPT